MSDYTDDTLDGLFCQECGTFLNEVVGYPRSCESCEVAPRIKPAKKVKPKKEDKQIDLL